MITKLCSLVRLAEGWNSCHTLFQPETGKYLLMSNLAEKIANKKLIYFGESHEQPEVVDLELKVLKLLVEAVKLHGKGDIHVFMEHFSFEQQEILNKYMLDQINEEELYELYKKTGSEGHEIKAYEPFISFAKSNSDRVKIQAGFLPRKFAQRLVKEGEEPVLQELKTLGYVKTVELEPGSESHYNFFESLISGRDLRTEFDAVGDRFKRIFPAQVLKDTAMATAIGKAIEDSSESSDKFLVVAGSGHIDHRFGVPERVDNFNLIPKDETIILTVRDKERIHFDEENPDVLKVDGFDSKYPGDVVLLYQETDEDEIVKEEIRAAYEKVASTADKSGNLRLANAVMSRLGYSQDQIDAAGIDAYNYQGVGCPHIHAGIQSGQSVLDVGSGLGVDSFIASQACGPGGSVVGIDISKGEVLHANTRAESRNSENTHFIQADMEKMPFHDESFDVVISNGAFCLAPNKEKAFREIHRVLKPGGKFSVCCTTLLTRLEEQVNWPVCMRVFMPLKDARPMLESIGFNDIQVDDSDSTMSLSITVEAEQGEGEVAEDMQSSETTQDQGKRRQGVHVGSEEFRHLQEYDMDRLCARVCLVGTKQ